MEVDVGFVFTADGFEVSAAGFGFEYWKTPGTFAAVDAQFEGDGLFFCFSRR